jgi:hypothetical protein
MRKKAAPINSGTKRGDPGSPYRACEGLFSKYPLAVLTISADGDVRSMVLMLTTGGHVKFFTLTQQAEGSGRFYHLHPWRAKGGAEIERDGTPGLNAEGQQAITAGLPLPADGSLFGWVSKGAVTAMIHFNTHYTPESPEPSWTVMPRTGTPSAQWPPFTGQGFLTASFWKHQRAGRIVSLASLIARTERTVFWADTNKLLGSGCLAVTRDVASPGGITLPRGVYAYSRALKARRAVPSMETVLAEYAPVDLAARFRA